MCYVEKVVGGSILHDEALGAGLVVKKDHQAERYANTYLPLGV